jgi:hypothetical protein
VIDCWEGPGDIKEEKGSHLVFSFFSYILKFLKFNFIIVIIDRLSIERYYFLCYFIIIALNLNRLFYFTYLATL